MSAVNIHEAKTNFSRLVERARRGERVVISKAGIPVAILGPIETSRRPRSPGHDRIVIHADFDDPGAFDLDATHPGDPLRPSRP